VALLASSIVNFLRKKKLFVVEYLVLACLMLVCNARRLTFYVLFIASHFMLQYYGLLSCKFVRNNDNYTRVNHIVP
jgi:hypothetical protein